MRKNVFLHYLAHQFWGLQVCTSVFLYYSSTVLTNPPFNLPSCFHLFSSSSIFLSYNTFFCSKFARVFLSYSSTVLTHLPFHLPASFYLSFFYSIFLSFITFFCSKYAHLSPSPIPRQSLHIPFHLTSSFYRSFSSSFCPLLLSSAPSLHLCLPFLFHDSPLTSLSIFPVPVFPPPLPPSFPYYILMLKYGALSLSFLLLFLLPFLITSLCSRYAALSSLFIYIS